VSVPAHRRRGSIAGFSGVHDSVKYIRTELARAGETMPQLLDRITIDPAICHGKPCLRGLRYPVETLLELLSSGMTIDEILADYEDLEREDLLAATAYAARQSPT
jgi:uncharacterized protein (DUF433 family)